MFGPVDHLVYGVQDLEAATDSLESLLGVRPAFGGSHLRAGTHNALLDLGAGTYLEVIGPDPSQPAPDGPRHFGLDTLTGPRLVGWAAKATDLERRVAVSRKAGYDPGAAVPMRRERPDGVLLEWMLTAGGPGGDGVAPFLIDWGAAAHPTETAPRGCRLRDLRAEHPEPERVGVMLRALGVELVVTAARDGEVRLVASIETPRGVVELT